MKKSPKWLEMPQELMANVFQRLQTTEILNSARRVCSTWRMICNDPTIWKVISVYKASDDSNIGYELQILTKQAVDFSCGELIDISIGGFGNDDLLEHIVISSKKLKRLCLVSCFRMTDRALIMAVKRLPHLETLEIDDTIISAEAIEEIGRNCPQLKSFTLSKVFRWINLKCDGYAFAIANSMPGLCHLQVFENQMTNDGLQAILDGCPHLQSLDLGMCGNLDLDHGNLGKQCMERIKDFKHHSIESCRVRIQNLRRYQV